MLGYLNDKEETLQTLKEHKDGKTWLHTGDIGCMDKTGLVYFKSRLKRIIISSGYNIYPSHLEEILNKHPKVFTSTVIGIHHPTKVQVAKAFIVLREGIEKTSELKNEIKAYCKKNLAKYAVPYEIEFVDSIPKTKLGKVAYRELK
jgi:long-chain acyl-CoA synthetase